MPVTMWCFTLVSVGLVGIPPCLGFVSKWYLAQGALSMSGVPGFFSWLAPAILLISALRESMQIDRIGELMALVNGSADDAGDDIVSEEQLYDYLCEAIGQTDALSLASIPQTVQAVTADYSGPTPDDARRLRLALCAMVSAYTAAQYKQAAEQWMEQMKEEQQ